MFNLILKLFFVCLLSSMSWSSLAVSREYIVMIEAKQSKTILHLYDYVISDTQLPVITEVFTQTELIGLPSFQTHPEEAGPAFKNIFDALSLYLEKYGISHENITILLRGEDDMLLLPRVTYQAIYNSLMHMVGSYHFKSISFANLSLQKQSLYEWLSVNYLDQRFQTQTETLSTLAIDNNAVRLAFETTSQSKETISLIILGKTYLIVSKHFDGIGLQEARKNITQDFAATNCYPFDALIELPRRIGHFYFPYCESLSRTWLNKHHVGHRMSLITFPIIIFGDAYDFYHFFTDDNFPTQEKLENQINKICLQPWEQWLKNYPAIPEKTLLLYCPTIVYLYDFLYKTALLRNQSIQLNNSIKQYPIDWTRGAILYKVLQPGTII